MRSTTEIFEVLNDSRILYAIFAVGLAEWVVSSYLLQEEIKRFP